MRLKEQRGPLTLNGPIVDARAVRCEVNGVEVLIAAADPDTVEAVLQLLQPGVTPPLTHVLIGQPPWAQNQTREHTLQDWFEEAAPVSEQAWKNLVPKRRGLL